MYRSNHEDRYQFPVPESIHDAKIRKRLLERDILNITKQLADGDRRDRSGKRLVLSDYRRWRSQARASHIFKQTEQVYLKDWIVERRRTLQASALGIFEPNDPRALLMQVRTLLGDEEDRSSEMGLLLDTINQFFQHVA